MAMPTYQTRSWTGSGDSVPATESANRPSFTPSSPHIQHHPGLWWHGLSTLLSGTGRTAVVSEHWITCRSFSSLVYTTVLIHVPSHSFRHYTYSHAGRFRSKQIYEQEMKLGHLVLDLDKLLLFGTAGSGKTCSLAALLGVDPPTIRRSTPLMKRPIEVVFIDVDGKKTVEDSNNRRTARCSC